MTATTTRRLTESKDSFLRFTMRLDAVLSGLTGIAGLALAGWLAEISGTSVTFEYAVSAFFVVFSLGVLAVAALPSVTTTGLMLAIGNAVFTVAAVVFVVSDMFDLTAAGVVISLATGAYTLVMAELQYQGWRRAKV